MTLKTTLLAGTILGVAAIASGAAMAQTAPAPASTQAQVDALNQQIQALKGQLKSLEEKLDKDIKAVDKKVTDAPTVSLDNGRPRFRSANRAFDVALRARIHADYGHWFPDSNFNAAGNNSGNTDLTEGFNFRRAYIGVSGTVFQDWGFVVTADFSGRNTGTGRLQEASLAFNGFKNWAIDLGFMQPTFTLEDSTSSNDIAFVERAAAVNAAVSQVGSEGRATFGFRHWGDNYRVMAAFTGNTVNSGSNPGDDQASFISRANFRPWTSSDGDFMVGGSFGYLWEPAQNATAAPFARGLSLSDRPENRIAGGVALVNTGTIDTEDYMVYGAEFVGTYKSFWAMGEYYQYEFDQRIAGRPDVDFDGYYLAAGYLLTGDRRQVSVQNGNISAPRVQWPFKVSGGHGTGAWELAARYSVLNLTNSALLPANFNPASTATTQGDQTVWTFGINWYPNAAIRFMLNYQIIEVDRPNVFDAEGDAVTFRTQFQF